MVSTRRGSSSRTWPAASVRRRSGRVIARATIRASRIGSSSTSRARPRICQARLVRRGALSAADDRGRDRHAGGEPLQDVDVARWPGRPSSGPRPWSTCRWRRPAGWPGPRANCLLTVPVSIDPRHLAALGDRRVVPVGLDRVVLARHGRGVRARRRSGRSMTCRPRSRSWVASSKASSSSE